MNAVVESVDALERDLLLTGGAPDQHRRVPGAGRQQVLALRVVLDAGDRGVARRRRQDVNAVGRRPSDDAQRIDRPRDEREQRQQQPLNVSEGGGAQQPSGTAIERENE